MILFLKKNKNFSFFLWKGVVKTANMCYNVGITFVDGQSFQKKT